MNNVYELPSVDMAISMARSVHAAASASRTTLQERLAEAHEALQAAQAARATLVADATAGRLLQPARAASVDADLRSAAATVALLSEALQPHDEQVAQAAETVAVLLAEQEYEQFQQRIHRRIDAAARVDAACAALAAAHADWGRHGQRIGGQLAQPDSHREIRAGIRAKPGPGRPPRPRRHCRHRLSSLAR